MPPLPFSILKKIDEWFKSACYFFNLRSLQEKIEETLYWSVEELGFQRQIASNRHSTESKRHNTGVHKTSIFSIKSFSKNRFRSRSLRTPVRKLRHDEKERSVKGLYWHITSNSVKISRWRTFNARLKSSITIDKHDRMDEIIQLLRKQSPMPRI